MKVGNLVRRKPNPVTNQPEILGLVTDTFNDGRVIRMIFINDESEPGHEQHWRSASHFEVVS